MIEDLRASAGGRLAQSLRVARGKLTPVVNWLDFLILALVAWLTLSAYMTGLIRETVGLASVILGVIMAGLFHDNVATNLALLAGDSPGTQISAYLLIFGVVVTIGLIVSFMLRRAARLFFLGWADRTGGAVFGFFKGVLIVQTVIVIFVLQPTLGMEEAIASSAIASFFLDTTPIVRALLPTEFDSAIHEFGPS